MALATMIQKEWLRATPARQKVVIAALHLAHIYAMRAYNEETDAVEINDLETALSVSQRAVEISKLLSHREAPHPRLKSEVLATHAQLFMMKREFPTAYSLAAEAVSADETNPEALRLQGNAAFALDRLDEADSLYALAEAIEPNLHGLEQARQLVRLERISRL